MAGGKREGAGRPPAPTELKKRMISIRLPEWLIQWMDDQPETNRAILIEDALKKMHGIKPPDVDCYVIQPIGCGKQHAPHQSTIKPSKSRK